MQNNDDKNEILEHEHKKNEIIIGGYYFEFSEKKISIRRKERKRKTDVWE